MAGTKPPENPYLAARQEWNERYGSYVKAATSWRIVGMTGMLMAVIGFSYALYQSTQVQLVPYIIEVDRLGTAASIGFPQQIEYADPRVVRATLGSFVSNFRSVRPDSVVQKQYIDRSYAHLRTGDPATEKVNAWFRGNSPFDRARSMTIAIEVTNIVPLSNQSYQVDWTEYERDRRDRRGGSRPGSIATGRRLTSNSQAPSRARTRRFFSSCPGARTGSSTTA